MTGGHRIGGLRSANHGDVALNDQPQHDGAIDTPVEADWIGAAVDDDDIPAPPSNRMWAMLAGLLVLAWLIGMIVLAWPRLMMPIDPIELTLFVAALCVPPALVGIAWMLAMRTSQAEARRFGASAAAMRAEAASLDRVIETLSRKLDANREMIADQTTALMAIGDSAAERLQLIGNGMAEQSRAIDQSARLLGDAANGAERKLSVVLSSLPRAQAEAAEMASRLEITGLAASEQAAALDTQLSALADRGRDADNIAGGAAQRLAAHIARMEATSEAAGARLEVVTGEMSATVDGVLERAAQAVEQSRQGITAQGDAMLAMLATNQAALDSAGDEGAAALQARIDTIGAAIAVLGERLSEQQAKGDSLIVSLTDGAGQADQRFALLHSNGMQRSQELAASISALTETSDSLKESMENGQYSARQVIGTAEELLTALDAAAREMDDTMPEALARLDARIGQSRGIVASAKPELLALVTAAESTHDAIEAIAGVVRQQRDMLAIVSQQLLEKLDMGRDQISGVRDIVDETVEGTRRFADETAPQLVDALVNIHNTANAAAIRAKETLTAIIPDASAALERDAARALGRAAERTIAVQLADLTQASDAAVAAAASASEKLSRQMLQISEATESVRREVAEARIEIEESDSDNFSRRVSLLIEALNSSAIDLSKVFATDVTDSAWAAYLKGDRGVFTRRAVRLLDHGEAREIVSMYDNDDAFRDHVNRYIHDFEAMLRQILTLRDGSPLGVTLLSSDMGKLYVILAQAIERLRA